MREFYRIELPTIFGMRTVNSFVFVEDEIVLIDCGEDTDASYKSLELGLRMHDLYIQDIDRIIITHAHVDHIGMAARVAKNADASVWVSELVYPWAVNPTEMWEQRKRSLGPEIMKFFAPELHEFIGTNYFEMMENMTSVWKAIPESVIHTFQSSGTLRIGSELWEAIYVPGHSQTQSAFYNPRTKEFISADMLLKITPTPVMEASIQNPQKRTKGIIQMLASYEKIRQLDIETVYPGHYEIFHNAHEVIDTQVARIQQRKEECFSIISKGVSSFFEILRAMYSDNFHPPAMIMLVGYLDLLEAEQKIRLELKEEVVQIIPV